MKMLVWIVACIFICLTWMGTAHAQQFETLDENTSLRLGGMWRVATDDGLDRVFFNATFRNDGPISRFLANRFDYTLTMASGETHKGTVTASDCYFDFGWDPWSSPCGDNIQPGALGEVVIGFRRVQRGEYPSKISILVRFEETVVRDFTVPETSVIVPIILAACWGTHALLRKRESG